MQLAQLFIAAALFAAEEPEFYVPESSKYNIVQSAMDSVRFTVEKTLLKCDCGAGHLRSTSSFVDPEAKVMGWHDFGNLEGPGWAANAVGGAYEMYVLGRLLHNPGWQDKALSILDHVLDHGFIDTETGFIKGYRDTVKNEFCLNYKHKSDWFCPGSMAKVAFQLLVFSEDLFRDTARAPEGLSVRRVRTLAGRMRSVAIQTAEWIYNHVPRTSNGWFPRRMTPSGETFKKTPDGGDDPFWQTSADGLFILQLWARLKKHGLADYSQQLAEYTAAFAKAGGFYGSINHDTYDPHENVAYSVAFRVLLEVSYLLESDAVRGFAYSKCLTGLEQFKMTEDRNGVATTGLLYMEKSWPTSYLWENAEAALAYFEAASDLRNSMPEVAKRHERDGLTILRAIAKHHHGPHGFLTEGVDWSNHVSQKHHIGGEYFGDIQYTEPFLNNQHIVEPTVFYLEKLAKKPGVPDMELWEDLEGNKLLSILLTGGSTEPSGGVILRVKRP